MSDVECSTLRRFSLREYARGKLNGDYTLPRLYGDEDRKRAVAELWPALGMTERRLENIVDIVAAALGLGRAL